MQRSTSKGSQTDLPAESAAVLDDIVEETFQNALHPQPVIPDDVVPPGQLESERVEKLQSRPNSPGVDPRKAMPISGEDAVELGEPLIDGLGTHDGPLHKAPTVHLPSKQVQERHLKEAREKKDHLSINLPGREGGRTADNLSSPGSTEQSAMTPALHDASTDTSPDNEGRYDAEREEKEDAPMTPVELRRSPGELAQQEQHDRVHQAQVEVARNEILKTIPAEAQDDLQSATQPLLENSSDMDVEMKDAPPQSDADPLTKETENMVEDTIEDNTTVQKSGEASASSTTQGPAKTDRRSVVEDSEADNSPAPDASTVNGATVPGSFEGSTNIEINNNAPIIEKAPEPPILEQSKLPLNSAAPESRKDQVAVPERMTTRVSSGAMRHKSVSEILGEIPRPNITSTAERSGTKPTAEANSSQTSNLQSRSPTPQSPVNRSVQIEKLKERERSKLAKVIFAARQKDYAGIPDDDQLNREQSDDYFTSLFLATATSNQRGALDIDKLLETAHKTVSTSNAYAPIQENKTVKILRRIYSLQSSGKWSLRQPKRSEEPQRPKTHWDVLLGEAMWMRRDFRMERRWKMIVAQLLAQDCAEWVNASPEDRKLMQVKASPPRLKSRDVETGEAPAQGEELSEGTVAPEGTMAPKDMNLDGAVDDEDVIPFPDVNPYTIFTYHNEDVVFRMRDSPTARRMLEELPWCDSPLRVPSSEPPTSSDVDPDRSWKRPALPLSKYVDGRMVLKDAEPPRKKPRYEYELEDEDKGPRDTLPPEQNDVALFNPDNKAIRDRIHAGHQFRPPSEFPMPNQTFFENRPSSQWTLQEDDDLRRFVRDYQYNWSLISNILTPKSMFSSGAERRTPWECFERWVALEGLPGDMQKTHYFRTYTSRVDAANRNVQAAANANAPQPNANGQIPPPRRRTTSSVRVERRRNQKHLTLVDAMRKLAKKREGAAQKQQQTAALAATRKPPEVPQQRIYNKTPQELSKIKHEQTEKMRMNVIAMQQRHLEQQRVCSPLISLPPLEMIFTHCFLGTSQTAKW